MVDCGHFFAFFVIAMCIFFCSTIVVEGDETLVAVHINDDMAPGSEVVRINCTGFEEKLWPGQEFHFGEARTYRIACNCIWRENDGLLSAFEPVRDKGHKDVFLSVKEDGFYLSYDQSNWTKIGDWSVTLCNSIVVN